VTIFILTQTVKWKSCYVLYIGGHKFSMARKFTLRALRRLYDVKPFFWSCVIFRINKAKIFQFNVNLFRANMNNWNMQEKSKFSLRSLHSLLYLLDKPSSGGPLVLSTIFFVWERAPRHWSCLFQAFCFQPASQGEKRWRRRGEMEGKDTRGGRAGGSNQGGCNFNILQSHRSQTAVRKNLGLFL